MADVVVKRYCKLLSFFYKNCGKYLNTASHAGTLDPYPMQNFIKIRLPPFAPQIRENSRRVTRLVFLFFCQPKAKTPAPIFTINTSNDVVSRKDVPFWGPENKSLHFDPMFPKKRNFLPTPYLQVTWPSQIYRKNRLEKALTMGMLESKLPLIVIVAR